MKSICASIEEKLLTALRGLNTELAVTGLLEVASVGSVKQEDLTGVQLRVYGMSQPHAAYCGWSANAEIRVNVEQAETPNGQIFFDAHEKIACWIQSLMVKAEVPELDTADVYMDGLQVSGGDADFDTANGVWYALWNVTLTGRLKTQGAEAQEDD